MASSQFRLTRVDHGSDAVQGVLPVARSGRIMAILGIRHRVPPRCEWVRPRYLGIRAQRQGSADTASVAPAGREAAPAGPVWWPSPQENRYGRQLVSSPGSRVGVPAEDEAKRLMTPLASGLTHVRDGEQEAAMTMTESAGLAGYLPMPGRKPCGPTGRAGTAANAARPALRKRCCCPGTCTAANTRS